MPDRDYADIALRHHVAEDFVRDIDLLIQSGAVAFALDAHTVLFFASQRRCAADLWLELQGASIMDYLNWAKQFQEHGPEDWNA